MPEPEAASKPRHRRSRLGATVVALLRTRITTGVLTILPILLTLWVIRIIVGWMRGASQWVFEWILYFPKVEPILERWGTLKKLEGIQRFETEFGFRPADVDLISLLPAPVRWGIAVFSVLLTIFILYVIGLFAANIVGRRVIGLIEQLVDRVPLIKTIYRLPKQMIASFSADQTQSYQRAALIPFPQEKMRCVGFITSIFKDSLTGEELATVFIPTTPNPTTGYLQVLKRAELVELDWTVEEAVRTIMSGGILRPDFLTIVPQKRQGDLPADMQGKIPDMPRNITQPPTPTEPDKPRM
jgi:uncharacterized membrane protein